MGVGAAIDEAVERCAAELGIPVEKVRTHMPNAVNCCSAGECVATPTVGLRWVAWDCSHTFTSQSCSCADISSHITVGLSRVESWRVQHAKGWKVCFCCRWNM